MVAERLSLERKNVVVGVRLDAHAGELLDWAMVKVADAGDTVVAICLSRNSVCISKEKPWLDGYLEEYEGICNKKQIALRAEVLKGISLRKVMVREAKNHCAAAVVVGVNKHRALGGLASIAKYCAKRLPPTTEVMAIYNGKVIFSSCFKITSEGPVLDPKPSFYVKSNLTFKDSCTNSEFGESEVSRFSFDRDMASKDDDVIMSPVKRHKRGSLSSISLPAENFVKQRPGWPLLQATITVTQPVLEAKKLSVVQWVMTLPRRSLSEISSKYRAEYSSEGECQQHISEKRTSENHVSQLEMPKDLEIILTKHSVQCKVFSHDFLKIITSEFSSDVTGNLIGKGGCTSVYKGILPDGKPVAVKVLGSSKEALMDFIREVDIITTLKQHKRIVPFIGICMEYNYLISMYDFMSKGSLEENIHGNKKEATPLSWEARFRIAVGVAEALNYIHNECLRPIIHRDVKSSNILLTEELEPLLCDFGLAIWGPTTTSVPFITESDVVGTFGYLAPEYFMYGKVSDKIDVYAFGVVLLELISGRKPIGIGIGLETTKRGFQESLVMWAKPRLEKRDYKSMLDPCLDGKIDEDQMHRMAQAAALCLTQAARLRPNISQILKILLGLLNGNESSSSSVGGGSWKGGGIDEDKEGEEIDDDEVYPESCATAAESHISVALVDVEDD
ncbi:protein kinase STUNTED-like isoform X2 [Andrographis paniculata]|uniref:protein kinase STUNTED-like isoform X2 n=1 Tax=Andrographis paniculata TaxID=175694 RepID=UPI0021E73DB9|nr:protein kinase STUNTED-like isoform X2 [Andrographis paniculata]